MIRSRMRAVLAALFVIATSAALAGPTSAQAAPPAPAKLVYPPSLTAAQWLATQPQAERDAMAARAKTVAKLPAGAVLTPMVATGPKPWGGEMWAALRADGLVQGCSAGISTMTSAGTRYVQDAGHCFKTADGTGDVIHSTAGQFKTPYSTCWGTGCPPVNIGNTGFGGATWNASGDRGWIRANLAGATYSEMATYDSRGAVNAVCACDPVVGEAATISAGKSARLIRGGVISAVNQSYTYTGNPSPIGNQAQFQTNWSVNGCTIPGDSGSPVIGPNHEFLGTVTGALVTGGWCFVGFDQGRKSMQSVGQQLAPSDPTA